MTPLPNLQGLSLITFLYSQQPQGPSFLFSSSCHRPSLLTTLCLTLSVLAQDFPRLITNRKTVCTPWRLTVQALASDCILIPVKTLETEKHRKAKVRTRQWLRIKPGQPGQIENSHTRFRKIKSFLFVCFVFPNEKKNIV